MNPLVAGAKLSYGKLLMIYWQPSEFEKSWVRSMVTTAPSINNLNKLTRCAAWGIKRLKRRRWIRIR